MVHYYIDPKTIAGGLVFLSVSAQAVGVALEEKLFLREPSLTSQALPP